MGPCVRRDDEGVCRYVVVKSPQLVPSQTSTAPSPLAGAGKMGGAMLTGWLAGGLDANRVVVVEPFPSDDIKALAANGIRLNPKVDAWLRPIRWWSR